MLRIARVTKTNGYKVGVVLTDGSKRTIDIGPYIAKGLEVFKPLADPTVFAKVFVDNGTLAWPGDIDMCPDVLLDTPIAVKGRAMAKRVADRWRKDAMAALCQFDGMTIYMYPDDHPPPHIHVRYAGKEAQVDMYSGKVIEGELPGPKRKVLKKWLALRKAQLADAYVVAQSGKNPDKIPPP